MGPSVGTRAHRQLVIDPRVQRLFLQYREAVRRKLRRCGIVGPDIEELLQQVFSVAHRRAAVVPRDEEGARRWLIDVARKHAANWHRLRRHTYEVLAPHTIDTTPSQPEDTEAQLSTIDLVHETTRLLHPEEREILFRHEVEGETLQEIAARLGLSKSGAHLRLSQARVRFIEKLELVQGQKRGHTALVPILPALVVLLRRFFGPTGPLSRLPFLRGLLDPSRWAARLSPLVSGPLTALTLAFLVPDATPKPKPHPSLATPPRPVAPPPAPAVTRAVQTDIGCNATLEPENVSTDDAAPDASTKAAPQLAQSAEPEDLDEQELIYVRIVACYDRGRIDEAMKTISFYQTKYPDGRFGNDLNALQRALLAKVKTVP